MSVATEAILSNELGIPYAAGGMCNDFDAWRDGEDAVSWEEIKTQMKLNSEKVLLVLSEALKLYEMAKKK